MAGRQRLSRAVRPDDRPVSALRAAARLPARTGVRSPTTICAICRSGTSWRGWIPTARARPAAGRARAQGSRLHRGRQGDAPRASSSSCSRAWSPRIARPARADRSSWRPRRSITRSCRCCATRTRISGRIPARRSRARGSRGPAMRGCRSSARSRFTRRRSAAGRAGMWPSEGSVSDEAVALMAAAGLKWIATDEDILARSLAARRCGRSCCIARIGSANAGRSRLFRDHALSDLIGFHYQSWDAERRRRLTSSSSVRDGGPAVRRGRPAGKTRPSPVILDGENAWEHYAGGGRPFLRALYGALERAADIETVTMAEAAAGPAAPLPSIFPGSWINGDFYIWIGHRDDHRAWDQLAAARAVFDERAAACRAEAARPGARGAAHRRRQRLVLVVRRRPLVRPRSPSSTTCSGAICATSTRRSARRFPRSCSRPTSRTGAGPDRLQPSGLLTVTLDGRDTSFLEWVGACRSAAGAPGGAMHEVAAVVADRRRSGSACPPTALSPAGWRRTARALARVRRRPRWRSSSAGADGPGLCRSSGRWVGGRDRLSKSRSRSTESASAAGVATCSSRFRSATESDVDPRSGSARPALDDRDSASPASVPSRTGKR